MEKKLKFFEDLPFKTKSNCEILYPSIDKQNIFYQKLSNYLKSLEIPEII